MRVLFLRALWPFSPIWKLKSHQARGWQWDNRRLSPHTLPYRPRATIWWAMALGAPGQAALSGSLASGSSARVVAGWQDRLHQGSARQRRAGDTNFSQSSGCCLNTSGTTRASVHPWAPGSSLWPSPVSGFLGSLAKPPFSFTLNKGEGRSGGR